MGLCSPWVARELYLFTGIQATSNKALSFIRWWERAGWCLFVSLSAGLHSAMPFSFELQSNGSMRDSTVWSLLSLFVIPDKYFLDQHPWLKTCSKTPTGTVRKNYIIFDIIFLYIFLTLYLWRDSHAFIYIISNHAFLHFDGMLWYG